MSALQPALADALADYLAVRRGLGFKLEREAGALAGFVALLDRRGHGHVTVDDAVAWVTLPDGAGRASLANRMTMVRGFATYLHTIDSGHQLPPADLFPHGPHRAVPYLYQDQDITALLAAAGALPMPLTALTVQTVIGLLAVTGLRVSEALALDTGDVDLDGDPAMLTVCRSKLGRSRLVPLHPSTAEALRVYLDRRRQLCASPVSAALFLTTVGTRKRYNHLRQTFARLAREVGIGGRSANCRPRLHDLRHTFAIRTLIDWYRDGGDVQARLPLLSAYLGHREPRYTYWYLHAAPELLGHAARRLESPQEAP
jgi:integrase